LSRPLLKVTTVVVLLLSASCSSPHVRGGAVVVRGEEPAGEVLGTFRIGSCSDARGSALSGPGGPVRVVRRKDDTLVLLEPRDRDVLSVDNVRDDGQMHTFQVILERKSGSRTLREYRVPVDPTTQGTFTVAHDYQKRDAQKGFVATYSAPSMVCALLPDAPRGDIPAAP